jgi:hypothetical protein
MPLEREPAGHDHRVVPPDHALPADHFGELHESLDNLSLVSEVGLNFL